MKKALFILGCNLFACLSITNIASAYTLEGTYWDQDTLSQHFHVQLSSAEEQAILDVQCPGVLSSDILVRYLKTPGFSWYYDIDVDNPDVNSQPAPDEYHDVSFAGQDASTCVYTSDTILNLYVPYNAPPTTLTTTEKTTNAIKNSGEVILLFFFKNLSTIILMSSSVLVALWGIKTIRNKLG